MGVNTPPQHLTSQALALLSEMPALLSFCSHIPTQIVTGMKNERRQEPLRAVPGHAPATCTFLFKTHRKQQHDNKSFSQQHQACSVRSHILGTVDTGASDTSVWSEGRRKWAQARQGLRGCRLHQRMRAGKASWR